MTFNKKIYAYLLPIALLTIYLLGSCLEEAVNRLKAKPYAFGQSNHLTVIADKDVWEGEVGDTFRYYFSSAFLILPQPEPIFDLKHFTPEQLAADPIRKELRTYILLGDITEANSPTAKLMQENIGPERIRSAEEGKKYGNLQKADKWAQGQLVIYMFGTDQASLIKNIQVSYPSIAKKIQEGDKELIEASVFAGGENRTVGKTVQDKLGIQLRVPKEYFLAMDDPKLLWVRKETTEMSSNILLHKLPYEDPTQLSYDGFKNLRDSIGKQYISSSVKGSFMQINDVSLPMFVTPTQFKELYAVEARGIWELTKDYMGGPFISYLIHNPETSELFLLDGFIFAPGKEKRNLIQDLEYIISTTEVL